MTPLAAKDREQESPLPKPHPGLKVLPICAGLWFGMMTFNELAKPSPHPLTVIGGMVAFVGFLLAALLNGQQDSKIDGLAESSKVPPPSMPSSADPPA